MFGLELGRGRTRSESLEPATGSDAENLLINTPEKHVDAPASRDFDFAPSAATKMEFLHLGMRASLICFHDSYVRSSSDSRVSVNMKFVQ